MICSLAGVARQYPRLTVRLPDWSAAAGEQWLLAGPSGSGKSTLLGLLAGLLRPSSGAVLVDGHDFARLPAAEIDRVRGARIGMVMQSLHLVASLNVLDNLLLAQYLGRQKPRAATALALLERLGVAGLARAKPHQVSQGQAQRVAIARAVINRPALLLADEPTSALDEANAELVIELLQREARDCGATLLVASHDQRIFGHLPHVLRLSGGGV